MNKRATKKKPAAPPRTDRRALELEDGSVRATIADGPHKGKVIEFDATEARFAIEKVEQKYKMGLPDSEVAEKATEFLREIQEAFRSIGVETYTLTVTKAVWLASLKEFQRIEKKTTEELSLLKSMESTPGA